MENSGRASGEADVEFGSHEEAIKAMSKVLIFTFLITILNNFENKLSMRP